MSDCPECKERNDQYGFILHALSDINVSLSRVWVVILLLAVAALFTMLFCASVARAETSKIDGGVGYIIQDEEIAISHPPPMVQPGPGVELLDVGGGNFECVRSADDITASGNTAPLKQSSDDKCLSARDIARGRPPRWVDCAKLARKPRDEHCWDVNCRCVTESGGECCSMAGCLVVHVDESIVCDRFCTRGRLEKR